MRKLGAPLGLLIAALLFGLPSAPQADDGPVAPVSAVRTVGMTVSDMSRALDFYTRVLPFVLGDR